MEQELDMSKARPIICLPLPNGLETTGLVDKIEGGYLLKNTVEVVFSEDPDKDHIQKLLEEAAKYLSGSL